MRSFCSDEVRAKTISGYSQTTSQSAAAREARAGPSRRREWTWSAAAALMPVPAPAPPRTASAVSGGARPVKVPVRRAMAAAVSP